MKKEELKQKIKAIVAKYHKSSDKNDHFKALSEIAQLRGGKIKDGEEYVNNTTKMIFIDSLGNEFKISPSNVKFCRWSPYESMKVRDSQYHLEQLEKIAKSKGGRIKEGEVYINTKTKITFIDQFGNEFKTNPNHIKNGCWSPYESMKVRDSQYHMEQLEKIAKSKGGRIKKGEKYVNTDTKITFIDQSGNEFKTTPDKIKCGRWSPYEKNFSEHICRQIIEQLYGRKFNSCWNTIKRKGKRNLQLDGYCPDLKIAFEYQGIQHTTGWKNNINSLICIQERDKEKKKICQKMGILLLEIDYYKNFKNVSYIIKHTIKEIKKSYKNNNLSIPEHIENFDIKKINIDFSKINHLNLMYKKLEQIVSLKEGKIKDGEIYVSSSTKMTFIDKLGNEFKQTPTNIILGRWTPYKSGKRNIRDKKYHTRILEEIVESKGGKIKDGETYINNSTKMTFIDKLGNKFRMRPSSIKSGQWSPYESDRVRDPEYHMKKLQEIVESKGGKIKDGEVYINSSTKMTFIDKLGNEFKMRSSDLKKGQWSPYESDKVRDPEYHMRNLQEIVELKGGKIKDGETYKNNSTKIIFIDKLGNEFQATPGHIKSGCWSPYEAGNTTNPKYHMDQLKKIAKSKGGKVKNGEVYIKSSIKMTFIDKLGNEFLMRPNDVKNGKWSPFESGRIKNPEYHMKQLKEIAKLKGGKIKEGEKYINYRTKITFIDEFGNEFQMRPSDIKKGLWISKKKQIKQL